MAADKARLCCDGEEPERGIRHAQPCERRKPWPRLALGTEYGFDTTFEKQTSGGTVFDYCKTIGQACDLGFRIVLDGKGSKKSCSSSASGPPSTQNRRYSPGGATC